MASNLLNKLFNSLVSNSTVLERLPEMSTETELDARLREIEDPKNQGETLDSRGFIKLTVVSLIVPIILLVIGWVVM